MTNDFAQGSYENDAAHSASKPYSLQCKKEYVANGETRESWSKLGVAFPNRLGGFNLCIELTPASFADAAVLILPPKDMTNPPSFVRKDRKPFVLWAVTHYTDRNNEEQARWRAIGVAFPTKSGGFSLKLELVPTNFTTTDLVMLPPKEKAADKAA